jgi:N-acetyl sugar amidotransferase
MTEICKICVMDKTTQFINFDKNGVCNYCHAHNELDKQFPINGNEHKIAQKMINEGKNNKFDCILGLSGGRDSTFLVYLVKSLGLRPLLVHFNDGFDNPTAGKNIRNIVKKTNFELRTITSDWRESKDIRLALIKASVPDMALGTDLGIAAALYSIAAKENIKYIISGVSFRTEGIVPLDWNYLDGKYLKSIMKKHGTIKLRSWNKFNAGFNFDTKEFLYYSLIKKIKFIPLLYHIDYNRRLIEKIIKEEFDWIYPGAHYFDDLYQSLMSYILRVKFKIDYRKFNYSALIRSKQLNRVEAIEKIKKIYSVEDNKIIDLCIKRLGVERDFINQILRQEPKNFLNFKSNYNIIKYFKIPIRIFCKIGILPPSLYFKFFQ